jgi:hypothetical protein
MGLPRTFAFPGEIIHPALVFAVGKVRRVEGASQAEDAINWVASKFGYEGYVDTHAITTGMGELHKSSRAKIVDESRGFFPKGKKKK